MDENPKLHVCKDFVNIRCSSNFNSYEMYNNFRRDPWYNCNCHNKWMGQDEFKSRTRLFAFHMGLIPLEKV